VLSAAVTKCVGFSLMKLLLFSSEGRRGRGIGFERRPLAHRPLASLREQRRPRAQRHSRPVVVDRDDRSKRVGQHRPRSRPPRKQSTTSGRSRNRCLRSGRTRSSVHQSLGACQQRRSGMGKMSLAGNLFR